MSKITAKNLHYDDTLPPFLARLRANNAGGDGKHEYTVARPKKARTAEEEAEDEPVYFDEGSGETLTKGEWEAREAGVQEGDQIEQAEGDDSSATQAEVTNEGKEKVAAIGGGKKRKAGKVIGGDEEDEVTPLEKAIGAKKPASTPTKKPEKGKGVKKGKKIKLSFGDDE